MFYPVQLVRVEPYVVMAVLHVQDLRLLQIRAYLSKARLLRAPPHNLPVRGLAYLSILVGPQYDAWEPSTSSDYFELHFETARIKARAQTSSP